MNSILDITFKHSKKMGQLTQPLQGMNIKTFWYFTLSSKGEFGYLGNHPEFAEFYFHNDLYKFNPFFKKNGLYKSGIFFSRSIEQNQYQHCWDLTSKHCNVDQSLIMVEETEDGYEGIGFASTPHSSMYQIYLNCLPILKKYADYFKVEAKTILSELNQKKVDLGSLLGKSFYQKPECLESSLNSKEMENFYYKIFGLLIPVSTLTPREKEVLKLVLKGQSAKEIGKQLSVSHRTIEHHLDNLKSKFNCESKSELISKLFYLNDLYNPLI